MRSRVELDWISVLPHRTGSLVIRSELAPVKNTKNLETLRARYRSRWDAYQVIADHNARLVKSGQQPSNEQLINEQQAVDAVALARTDLLAAMSRE